MNERLAFTGRALVWIALLFVLTSFAVLLATRNPAARSLAQVGVLAAGAGVALQLAAGDGPDTTP